nr:hypothetical protein [Tanacetum cinerariifolium]
MDLFNLISALNPSKVKTGLRSRAAFDGHREPGAASEVSLEEEVAAMGPCLSKKRHRRVNDGADENAPPKVLRKDYASVHPEQSTRGGKSLPTMGLATDSTFVTPADTKGVSDPDPLSSTEPQPHPEQSITHVATMEVQDTHSAKSAGSGKSTSSPSMVGSPGDHIVPPGYFFEFRHMPNAEFLSQYNKNLAQQVAMGSQLRLRFEQEVGFLKKARAQIARQDQRIQVKEEEIKKLDQEVQGLQNQTSNLKTLLEAEEDMKKAAKAKNVDLTKELESLRTQVEKRCVEMDARLDALSIDFDEELYPHMLIAIAGRRWVIRHGLHLAVIKSGTWHRAWEGRRDLEVVEAYDLEANNKYLQALQDLKDLKYPIVDQLEGLKDAPMEVIMASLHLEIDSEEDAPKWIHDLRPSTSQLKIPVYPEVRNPRDPWTVKEQMLLEEAIAANVSRGEKKKRCRVVCRTHGVGSAHHTRSDGVPVSVPTVAPQGIAILLANAATQTETSEDDASPRLLRSKSLPPMYNLDWP